MVCDDAHLSAVQSCSGCCLQGRPVLLSCNSSINFLQLILHVGHAPKHTFMHSITTLLAKPLLYAGI